MLLFVLYVPIVRGLIFIRNQEVCHVHCLDAVIVATGEVICQEDVLGVIIRNGKQTVIFSMFGLLGFNLLGDLDIEFFALTSCDKVNFAVCGLTDIHGIATAAKLKVNHVLKACGNGVGVVTKNAIAESSISKIEFLLCFENLLALHIVA